MMRLSNQQTMGKSANTLPFLRKGNRGDLCSGNPPVDRKVLFLFERGDNNMSSIFAGITVL